MRKSAAGATSIVARLLASGAALALLRPVEARAGPDTPITSLIVERSEDDVLLLALRVEQEIVADSLPMYAPRSGSGVLVPLGEICRILGLGITVDVSRGLASGFFLTENRLFSLDVISQTVIVEGQPERFDASSIEVHRDDIYVEAALLSEWLPLHLNVDFYGSMITVEPREKLPLQLRLEREKKLEMSRASQRGPPDSLPRLELPYLLAGGPFIDQTVRFSRRPSAEGPAPNGVQYSTYATGDVLFMEASAFVAGTEDAINEARISLSRKNRALEVTVGDVFYPGLDLVAAPRSGPGVLVTNLPRDQPTQFDRQSFRGDLPPGWEVELYRGGELLAYAQSRADGLYEFLDVPLLFGMNVFRLEFYGPQGQLHSETRLYNVSSTLTPSGKFYYRLVGNDSGQRLAGDPPADSRAGASLELSAGLAKNLSASSSVAMVDLPDGHHVYLKSGLRAYWGLLFANLDVASDRGGGSVWQATLQSRVRAFGFQLQHASLYDFVSEQFISAGPLRSRTTLRLDTALPDSFLPRIPLFLEVRQDLLESGLRINAVNAHASAFRRGFSVANQATWSFSSGGSSESTSTASGQFLVSRFLQAFAFRGEAIYDIKPIRQMTSVAVTAERRLARNLLVSGGINRLIHPGQTRYLAGVSKLEGAFGYGITMDYSSPAGLGASILVSVGLGRDARNGKWHTQARTLAASGGVSGRAFLDTDGNGRLDAGEEPIANVGFLLNGSGNLSLTDDAGEAFIPNLAPYREIDVALATSTLEDPFWRSENEGVRLTPRPGKVAVVDFPVVISGEITGTVYLKRDGGSREASDVELELVDSQETVVKKVRSAYDGFYDLTEIRPGRYTLRVAVEQLARLHVAAAPSRELEMAPSGTVLDGIDFIIDVE